MAFPKKDIHGGWPPPAANSFPSCSKSRFYDNCLVACEKDSCQSFISSPVSTFCNQNLLRLRPLLARPAGGYLLRPFFIISYLKIVKTSLIQINSEKEGRFYAHGFYQWTISSNKKNWLLFHDANATCMTLLLLCVAWRTSYACFASLLLKWRLLCLLLIIERQQ